MVLPADKRQAVLEAIYGGRKIEATKLVRKATNCGLKEANELVETFSAELYAKEPQKFSSAPGTKGGCTVLVLAGTLILAAIGLLMMLFV